MSATDESADLLRRPATSSDNSFYAGTTLFDMLDTNRDNLLTGSDGFTTPGGTIGVSQSASALTIFLGVDSIRFENVASIASADWV